MLATFVDVQNEFSEIAGEVDHLRMSIEGLDRSALDAGSHAAWEAVHIYASASGKIYTGLERVMSRIAADVDGATVGRSDGWHTSLLKRLAHPFPDTRPAVISQDCDGRLDRLRAFRRRERNTYGLRFDLDIVVERGREAIDTFEVFRREVVQFFQARLGPGES